MSSGTVEVVADVAHALGLVSLAVLAFADHREHKFEDVPDKKATVARWRIVAVWSLIVLAIFDVGAFALDQYGRYLRRPRALSANQRAAIVSALSRNPGRVTLASSAGEIESIVFRDDLAAALREAGWGAETQSHIAAFEVVGIVIVIKGDPANCRVPVGSNADRLFDAFRAASLEFSGHCLPESPHTAEAPEILVGRNPDSDAGMQTIEAISRQRAESRSPEKRH